jgi:hypothetical protein
LGADFLESFLKDKLKKPSKRINGHLHRVQHDILILICSQESWQFGLARQILFPMEYAPVFCGPNLLSLDELQVNGEGDGKTEMMLFSDKCNDNDDSEVVIEDNSDHSLGEYSARCSKSRKSDHIFQVPKQSKYSDGLNQDQQWVILGDCGVSAPVLQNNGSWHYQLYHPGTPDDSISIRNITVNSSVQQAQAQAQA